MSTAGIYNAIVELTGQVKRIADVMEAIATPEVLRQLDRWSTPPIVMVNPDDTGVYQAPDGGYITYRPTAPEKPKPTMVRVICDGCGSYSGYYNQFEQTLPQGWQTVGTKDYCGVCLRDLESRSHSALLADEVEGEDGQDDHR